MAKPRASTISRTSTRSAARRIGTPARGESPQRGICTNVGARPLRTHAVGSIDRRSLRQGADPRRNALSQAAGDTAAAAPWHTRLLQKAHQFAHDTHGHRHTDQLDRRIAALHQPVHQQGEAQGQQVGHQLVQHILLQRHRRLTGVHH